jgi:radical SAM superfamily enzyme YgiQ (UPF0313 family)
MLNLPQHLKPDTLIEQGLSPDILFINVPSSFNAEVLPSEDEPSFGLLRLATYLEQNGSVPGILDAQRGGLSPEAIRAVLLQVKPKMVGLNPTSVNVPIAQVIAQICDELSIPYILGGVQATLDPALTLSQYFPTAFALVRGRGEIAVKQLVVNYVEGAKRDVSGVYYGGDQVEGRQDFAETAGSLEELPVLPQER